MKNFNELLEELIKGISERVSENLIKNIGMPAPLVEPDYIDISHIAVIINLKVSTV